MEHVVEILHELIEAVKPSLPANRVGELHDLADKAADIAKGAEEVAAEVGADTAQETPENAGA